MWNPDVLPIFDGSSAPSYTFTEGIRAIELITDAHAEVRLGLVSQIPAGSEIECCGPGFNEVTVKIRWRGKFYFVFQQDLEGQCKPAAMCACC
jgi:hypothetical protein